jgi:hypothetical protein
VGLELENSSVAASDLLARIAEGETIHLTRCRISGILDLKTLLCDSPCSIENLRLFKEGDTVVLVLPQSLYFNSCTFEHDVFFAGTWEQPESMKVIFEQDVIFNSSVFSGQTRFSNAEFKGLAGFDGCTFSRVCSFRKAVFHERAMFRTAAFEGYGLFNDAVFAGDTRFANSSFGKGANYSNAQFRSQCDFAAVYSRSKAVPVYDGVVFTRKRFGDDESFWRFIKQACQEAGYYQQAGEGFYRERCAHFWQKFRGPFYEKLSAGKKLQRWLSGGRFLPELIFGRFLFGYGERPVRVLLSGAVIIILCGLFFSSDMAHLAYSFDKECDLSLFEGMYFSTITFTTLGFGEIYPTGNDWLTRVVTMFESLSGICLVTLFVVSLSKRFSRG